MTVFPFTLPGPQFLLFYLGFAALVLFAFWYYLSAGPQPPARISELTGDPYQIAHMRAGEDEVIRVALVNLVDRGLLTFDGKGTLHTAKSDAREFVRRPVEAAILGRCQTPTTAENVFGSGSVRAACAAYERDLERKGLLADADARNVRTAALIAVFGLLGGVGVARLIQALSRGRTELEFLVILGVGAVGLAYFLYRRMYRVTAAGRRALSSLETLLWRLKERAYGIAPGGATNEALLLAAVFGIRHLPFGWIEQLFPRVKSSGDGCGGGCGSGCGGGGGGGGGCGGCGGD